MQLNLLPQTSALPAGLAYTPSFISTDEEQTFLAAVDANPWRSDLKRRVQHYGWRYQYKDRKLDTSLYLGPLPAWLVEIAARLPQFERAPDQVIVNEYLPGQGIAPHIDCAPCFGGTIASLSLGGACVMDFVDTKGEKINLLLEPRSLVTLTGPARYNWTHGIAPRQTDRWNGAVIRRTRRVSLTFRTVII